MADKIVNGKASGRKVITQERLKELLHCVYADAANRIFGEFARME